MVMAMLMIVIILIIIITIFSIMMGVKIYLPWARSYLVTPKDTVKFEAKTDVLYRKSLG